MISGNARQERTTIIFEVAIAHGCTLHGGDLLLERVD
jgi:hypothetical protein